jgi:hypothetical protein
MVEARGREGRQVHVDRWEDERARGREGERARGREGERARGREGERANKKREVKHVYYTGRGICKGDTALYE